MATCSKIERRISYATPLAFGHSVLRNSPRQNVVQQYRLERRECRLGGQWTVDVLGECAPMESDEGRGADANCRLLQSERVP